MFFALNLLAMIFIPCFQIVGMFMKSKAPQKIKNHNFLLTKNYIIYFGLEVLKMLKRETVGTSFV